MTEAQKQKELLIQTKNSQPLRKYAVRWILLSLSLSFLVVIGGCNVNCGSPLSFSIIAMGEDGFLKLLFRTREC